MLAYALYRPGTSKVLGPLTDVYARLMTRGLVTVTPVRSTSGWLRNKRYLLWARIIDERSRHATSATEVSVTPIAWTHSQVKWISLPV
jgi:hypothetical protein